MSTIATARILWSRIDGAWSVEPWAMLDPLQPGFQKVWVNGLEQSPARGGVEFIGAGITADTNDPLKLIITFPTAGGPPPPVMPAEIPVITPFPALVAGVINNWNVDYPFSEYAVSILRVTGTGPLDITGIAAPVASISSTIVNARDDIITLRNASTSSTIANRILCSTGANVVLSPNGAARLFYDVASSRWR